MGAWQFWRGCFRTGGLCNWQTWHIKRWTDCHDIRYQSHPPKSIPSSTQTHERYFGQEGPNKVKMIMDQISEMVEGSPGDCKKIFASKPHTTWDNYFSRDNIHNWLGENGFRTTMTCRRDCLPKDIPAKYLHKKKTDTRARTKAA